MTSFPGHRKLGKYGSESRAALRFSDLMDTLPEKGPCPTPHKVSYPSRKVAKQGAKAAKGAGNVTGKIRPYLCPCGRWHTGHLPKVAIAESRSVTLL